ncbi:ABC transporter C family member 14 [Selaginella moellendorffii]|nr:ABC transporter C family member 14 [Selaginella moellendorffii]|eukprot:XP_002991601.2 ABC transporter C family member 14 [Selaginella moellendorffii]
MDEVSSRDFLLLQICSTNSGTESTLDWIMFYLFNPCSQRAIVSVIQLLFLAVFVVLAIIKTASQLRTSRHSSYGKEVTTTKSTKMFHATLALASMAGILYAAVDACLLWLKLAREEASVATVDIMFSTIQSFKWLCFVVIVGHEKKFNILVHPWTIRSWWVIDFLLSALLFSTAVQRVVLRFDAHLAGNGIVSLVMFPVSIFFLVVAIRGWTGIVICSSSVAKPLLENGHLEKVVDDGIAEEVLPTTGYATAGVFNRAVWKWLTPLLDKGYKSPLQLHDIPLLAPDDRAESNYSRFKRDWPENDPGSHPVRSTLLKCFGGILFRNGLLALIRLCVMYAGPILIQRFVSYTANAYQGPAYEGYLLVLVLLIAKVIEVFSSHQYNFQSMKLGMMVRSTIIAAVYQKGLRLSSSSKQGHGVGHIVNYMVVDAQQLSDLMYQLHNLWVLPAQVCIALAILYGVMGLPMLAGFFVMAIIIALNFYYTKKQREHQTKLMAMRDERMKATSEVLNFMKIIKFQAWEDHFLGRVEGYRMREYTSLRKFLIVLAQNIAALWMCSSLVATVTFAACVVFNVELTAAKVFTATATFRILQEPVRAFPQALISISQSLVSLERLDKYMVSDELDTKAVEKLPADADAAVDVEDGTFSWEEDEPTLKDINVHVKKGQLVAIVGTVGSGKSSMLTALLGEMRKLSGKVRISGSTAYVPQTAWIQNATIEDNILFGLPMDKARYAAVVRSCALEQDFKLMEFGDQTEIGERGINLSGGQKQRIQLARAVYQDSDIYLLDDVFSAVDAHTGTHLFQECILGYLRKKTVLLVTHQVEFLHHADLVLVLRDGTIVQSGKYSELLEKGTDLEVLVAAHHSAMESISMDEQDVVTDLPLEATQERKLSFKRRPSIREPRQPQKLKGSAKLIDEEQREAGRVGWRVYWLYFTKAFGWPTLPIIVSCQGLWTVVSIASDYWLAAETAKTSFSAAAFVKVYLVLSAISWVLVIGRVSFQTVAGLKAAQMFYFDMLRSIFRSPMSFFDTTPSGRILSRSSTDQAQLDVLVPFFVSGTIATFLGTLGSVIVACQVTWPLIFLILPLAWAFLFYQNYYITTSRELTRLDSISKAPVIFHFSETLAGLPTIRAFKKQESFIDGNVDRVNTNIRMEFHNIASNEWLGLRLELLGTIVLCASALLLVTLPASIIAPENVGLALSYGLVLNSSLFWSVWIACMLENKMVSVERIRQYTTIESEAPRINDDYRAPLIWPSQGTVAVRNLQLRYRPNTPLVLKGVTLTIQGGDKVGVVGRTGSGKSTLIQAFFRLVEPCGGEVRIDGIDITQLGLADLRSRFGIIPQEPILFEGSIRSNVDPLGQYSDDRIWEVLRKCQLADAVQQKTGGLDSSVVDNGDNWSVGQKQLFCLGRALLKDSRLLFLDEATASVDAQTDAVIQKTIREQFASSTVVSVAHRIPSVMDSDKVLVMGEGEVKEYDRPSVLLERPTSLFAALVREYSARSGV